MTLIRPESTSRPPSASRPLVSYNKFAQYHAHRYSNTLYLHRASDKNTNKHIYNYVYTSGKMLLSGTWKREICFLPQSVRKPGTRHVKGKYVSFLQASESEEQGMKKANMFERWSDLSDHETSLVWEDRFYLVDNKRFRPKSSYMSKYVSFLQP